MATAANLEGVVNQVLIYGEEGEYDLCLQYQNHRDFWWPNFIQIDQEIFFIFGAIWQNTTLSLVSILEVKGVDRLIKL